MPLPAMSRYLCVAEDPACGGWTGPFRPALSFSAPATSPSLHPTPALPLRPACYHRHFLASAATPQLLLSQDLEAGCSEITEINEIMPANLDTDMTSLSVSSPLWSPKCEAVTKKIHYDVQSASHDSEGGGYKYSSMQATPSESPSHPSFGRHSSSSSIIRFFRILLDNSGLSLLSKVVLVFISILLIITGICLLIWGAERPYIPDVDVKTIAIDHFYASDGIDHTGVPTKLVSVNCSINMVVYNPARFGIDVTSSPVRLLYSDISIGVGKVRKYYQPRNSHRRVSAVIHGQKVALYDAGGGLDLSSDDGSVPLTLEFVLISRGYVISQLVWVTHNVHITCNITIDAKATRPIRFPKDAYAVYKV